MRLYIQEEKKLVKFNLPLKIDGSLLFTYKSFDTGIENSINIDSMNNNWVLKSNGCINIINNSNNTFLENIILNDYTCIPISVIGKDSPTYIYSLPTIEDVLLEYDTSNVEQITVGSSSDNNIIYKRDIVSPRSFTIITKNNETVLAVNDKNSHIYVNDKRVLDSINLFAGDIIFISGLKIIWMKKFIQIIMLENCIEIKNLNIYTEYKNLNNTQYTPVSEVDSNILLYSDDEYFSHMPRLRSVIEAKEIKIDAPPGKQLKDDEMPFILTLGTSFTMMGMMMINMYNIIYNVSNGKDIITLIPNILMVIVMLIGSFLMPQLVRKWQKKNSIKKEEKRQKKYGEYLSKKETEIQYIIRNEEQILRENNVDLKQCQNIIETKNRTLWNREITDDDFLDIRVGIGNKPATLIVNSPEEKFTLDDDNLYQMVCEIKSKYNTLKDVPISINFKNEIVTALILNSKFNDHFIDGMMLQLITNHSPLDLKIIIITNKINESKWDYVRYIPHCWSDDKSIRFFATNQDDVKILSQYLENEYNDRKDKRKEKEQQNNETSTEKKENYALYDSYYLIITDDFNSIKNLNFIEDLLENQINYGFSLIAIEKNMKHLPKECQKFMCINDTESGIFQGDIVETQMIKFIADYDINLNMRKISKKIGDVPVQGKDSEHELPTFLPFLEMYNVGKIEQLNIINRWASSEPTKSLQAPVGVHKNGELFQLDLHEKADGPHGLIAGSTGSGKSEFIITYILSMAINYDPKEVQFVLIDYKGGGLAGAFENREKQISIPHLAGTITNLDSASINRTLVSIESELKRRQRLFNEVREKTNESTMDIYKYQRLYREGIVEQPISHLFIISDEFAELKQQQPDFMQQLISTSRIGRSLGVHLILATQKPSGVVNDQIWSNSKFKVCLKVQDRSDSMEMLKKPDAASIKETGRFYLQVGYDEYFDIGQSAWSGERYIPVERIVKKLDDSINFVDNCGNVLKRVNEIKIEEKVEEDIGDQLTNIVRYLKEIASKEKTKQTKLWLPPLQNEININNLIKKYSYVVNKKSLNAVIGEYDAPKTQEQGLLIYDLLKDGNLLIYGIPGSGKENLISTIVYNLITNYSPQDINFYIGDFGSETLKNFQNFPHVGDVFITEETQKIENIIKMLSKEFERRKKDYSEYGGNYIEYCKFSGQKDPVWVIVLNNIEIFNETYPRIQDAFASFIRDGSKYGIIFIVSTTVKNAVRSRETQYFQTKICLKMPNDYDYRDLIGADKGLIPTDNYGRGVICIDGEKSYEFQTADVVIREKRTQFIREESKRITEFYPRFKARKIPILPDVVYVDDVLFELKGLNCLPIGIEKNSLEVYVYDFLELKTNLVAAKQIKNHIYFVYALIKQMLLLKNVNVYVLDAIGIYRGNYEGVRVFRDNLEEGFITANNNVANDIKQENVNVYICLGINELKNKLEPKYKKYIEVLFSNMKNAKKNTFIFFDDSENYKEIQIEDWFRNNINNTYGLWLGEDVGIQTSLGVMSLSLEDKQTQFPCIGYPIYQGYHMIIKYVVDGVDRNEE